MSESAVYAVLRRHDAVSGRPRPDSQNTEKEYRNKPQYPHHHWHTDIAYIKIQGVFYFLIMVIDGYSRFLLGWDLMTDMTTHSVSLFVQQTKEKYPHTKPMLIHDNGSAFIALDFKRLVTALGIQQVFTRRNHPQTNGKIERMNGTVKNEAIRPGSPQSYEDAWNIMNEYHYLYNYQRLHAAIQFLRPADMFFGRQDEVLKQRRLKLLEARIQRKRFNRERKFAA